MRSGDRDRFGDVPGGGGERPEDGFWRRPEDDEIEEALAALRRSEQADMPSDEAFRASVLPEARRIARRTPPPRLWVSVAAAAALILAATGFFLFDRAPEREPERLLSSLGSSVKMALETGPDDGIRMLELLVQDDTEALALIEDEPAETRASDRAIAAARQELSLRETVLREREAAIPMLLDLIEGKGPEGRPSDAMRTEAAILLSILRPQGAGEAIYQEIVRVIDVRNPSLNELLVAIRVILDTEPDEPRWAAPLGNELQTMVLDEDGRLREVGLSVLAALMREYDAISYPDTGLTVLGDDPSAQSLKYAFRLLTPDVIRSRRGELIDRCKGLLLGGEVDKAKEALVFLARNEMKEDPGDLIPIVESLAASESRDMGLRRQAATTLAQLTRKPFAEIYERYGIDPNAR